VDSDAAPLTGSEDFAYMLNSIPGCYFLIGNGDNGHTDGKRVGPCSVHNPHYDFNDDALSVGAQMWVDLIEQFFCETSVK
jgi:hippurate hydrolase